MIEHISSYVDSNRNSIVRCLRSLVSMQGGTENTEAVNRVGMLFTREFTALGFSLKKFDGHGFGDHLLFANHSCRRSCVLAGHMDTTFTDYRHLPEFHVRGNRCMGPGTGDMLGGLVVFLFAVKCLNHLELLENIPLTVFLNSDEERGSPTSRPIFENLVQKTTYAMVGESGGKKGEIVVGRRGKLSCNILVEGVEGHAGNLDGGKVSAVEEVAHKIIVIERLNSRWENTDLNAGKVWGGIAGNTVARQAGLSVDIRYACPEHEGEIKKTIDRIVNETIVDGCSSQVIITSERPLWHGSQKNAGQERLTETLRLAAEQLQVPFGTEMRKGTSDANFFGASGVNIVDGMGPIGFHDHSENEYILLDSLFDRIKLCALALCRLHPEQ
jgi:glutamate carboxypeptidase